ncbi:hypothetical protein BGW80DRAFT_1180133, partial [Lactifluus volemus]
VSALFNTPNFVDNRAWIAEYARWATRPDGPGIWEIPTPINCVCLEDSEDYIRPQNFFQLEFIISSLTLFIKLCKGSHCDFGYPKGTLGLAVARVGAYLHSHASSTDADWP